MLRKNVVWAYRRCQFFLTSHAFSEKIGGIIFPIFQTILLVVRSQVSGNFKGKYHDFPQKCISSKETFGNIRMLIRRFSSALYCRAKEKRPMNIRELPNFLRLNDYFWRKLPISFLGIFTLFGSNHERNSLKNRKEIFLKVPENSWYI